MKERFEISQVEEQSRSPYVQGVVGGSSKPREPSELCKTVQLSKPCLGESTVESSDTAAR